MRQIGRIETQNVLLLRYYFRSCLSLATCGSAAYGSAARTKSVVVDPLPESSDGVSPS